MCAALWLFPFAAQGKDVYNNGGTVKFDACGVSKAMGDCCTLPPPTCYSCDSSVGKCAADRAGSQTPDSCIATCTKPTPTPAPPALNKAVH
jgi:hypothetical protein